jgi:hypothetical protein
MIGCLQKAYLEFFASPEIVHALFEAVAQFPSLTIHAAAYSSTRLRTNSKRQDSVTAVTWYARLAMGNFLG